MLSRAGQELSLRVSSDEMAKIRPFMGIDRILSFILVVVILIQSVNKNYLPVYL